MGKKGIKEYTKICVSFNTEFEGYYIPLGALYGRCKAPYETGVEYIFWICETPKQAFHATTMPVYILKPSWKNHKWQQIKIGYNHIIAKNVRNKCHELSGIPAIKTSKDIQGIKARKELKRVSEEVRSLSSEFGLHKHPEPQSRCFKQAQVDGKGYNIAWERNIQPMQDIDGYHYNGCPVHYESGKQLPPAAFTSFEGVTDTERARRRDGMKVNQTKCRPQKRA